MIARRFLVLPILLSASGCLRAGAPAPSSPATVQLVTQPYQRVHFVGQVPRAEEYRLVGRVTGRAVPEGFVEAAHDARIDIKRKAAELHASLVKIDRLRLPPPTRSRGSRSSVILIGRAYSRVTERTLPSLGVKKTRVPEEGEDEISLVHY